MEKSTPPNTPLRPVKLTTAEIEISEAALDDVESISDIDARAYRGLLLEHGLSPDYVESTIEKFRGPDYFKEVLQKKQDRILLAKLGGQIIGYTQFGPSQIKEVDFQQEDREIKKIYVDPDFQSRGVGTTLLDAALSDESMADAPNIYLVSWTLNDKANGLYRKSGFEHVQNITWKTTDPTQPEETFIDSIMVRRQNLQLSQ